MADFQDYADQIAKCLITFQYIEEALKQNLIRLNVLTHFCIKKYVPYDLKPNLHSIDNAAMGRLVEMYKNYCDDAGLISSLRKIKDHRDNIAHKGFLMTVEEQHDKENIELEISKLKEINEFAKKLMYKQMKSCEGIEAILNQIAAEQRSRTESEESPAPD